MNIYKENNFYWKGDNYRDDRMFVSNIATASDNQGRPCWNLATYRNTLTLPFIRNDFFDTEIQLMNYLKRIEPLTPLISNNEKPLVIPKNISSNDYDSIWRYFNQWLVRQKLFSAVNGISHVPFYVDKRGYKEGLFHVTIEKI
tara:strand:- start:4228 stop:4656 length:429 start_codon:yes stop_codon:yes gene_type:complete